ncbi:protein rep, partial [Helicobacter bizzozeronii]|uniref:protein rep n=1 Tax=Helicobacter bizzozeronii TaxID=56877 RepID=UPI002552DF80
MLNIPQKALKSKKSNLTSAINITPSPAQNHLNLNLQRDYSQVRHAYRDIAHELIDNPNYKRHYLGKIKRETFFSRATALELCGEIMLTTWHKEGEGEKEIPHAWHCKDSKCQTCSSLKAKQRTIMLENTLAKYLLSGAVTLEDMRLVMITISPKNVPLEKLRNSTKALNAYVNKLLTRKKFLRDRFAPRGLGGYIRGTEIVGMSFDTQLGQGMTHPHVHLLVLVHYSYYTERYLTQRAFSEMIAEQFKTPIVIDDYNSPTEDKDGNKLEPKKIKVKLEGNNVDMRVVFDGRKFASKLASKATDKGKEKVEQEISRVMFEIVKQFKMESTEQSPATEEQQRIQESAQEFCSEIKESSKDALGYPDKGIMNPVQLRKLGALDRKKNKAYKEALEQYKQGKITKKELKQYEFKPYFLMLAEQTKGLRAVGSGGVFARRNMANADELTLPHKAQVIQYDHTAVDRVKPPQGEDKDKPLGQY